MAFTTYGVIDIPLEDFWVWVQTYLNSTNVIFNGDVVWTKECLIITEFDSGEVFTIDMVSFWTFAKTYMPVLGDNVEFKFGVPFFERCNVFGVIIPFIASNTNTSVHDFILGDLKSNLDVSW